MAVAKRGEMFQRVPVNPPKKNVFPQSYELKTSANIGAIIPIFCKEGLPAQTTKLGTECFVRTMPLVAPLMHQVDIYMHYMLVPQRLMWDNWENFLTGGQDGKQKFNKPYMTINSLFQLLFDAYSFDDQTIVSERERVRSMLNLHFGPKSLWVRLGYPNLKPFIDEAYTGATTYPVWDNEKIDITPILAYNWIYSEYYRDQNLEPAFNLKHFQKYDGDLSDAFSTYINPPGTDTSVDLLYDWRTNIKNMFSLRNRAWEKDYFMSALPEPQRGPDVPIEITGDIVNNDEPMTFYNKIGAIMPTMDSPIVVGEPGDGISYELMDSDVKGALFYNSGLELQNAQFTVNSLRLAVRLQEFYELNMRVGNRYKEMIVGHFGVFTPDYRLDRPQYLGGSKFPLQISQVLQTNAQSVDPGDGTSPSGGSPLGSMAGHAIAGQSIFQFKESFYEHCWVIGLLSIRPRVSYMSQGLHRQFTRFDVLDYYWEKFAHLGEQDVKMKELLYRPSSTSNGLVVNLDEANNEVFGYQDRYSEYKYYENQIQGEFLDTLDYWHLGLKFDTFYPARPQLNDSFVHINYSGDDMDRIFAYQDPTFDQFLLQIQFNINNILPMPIFGIPKL